MASQAICRTRRFKTFEEMLSFLNISRATYFNQKKRGAIKVKTEKAGQDTYYILQTDNIYRAYTRRKRAEVVQEKLSRYHGQYLSEWVEWRECGLHLKRWSESYKKDQLRFIQIFLLEYRTVTPENLRNWLLTVPAIQQTKRRCMQASVSGFAKFLQYKGVITSEEYLKIRALYPKKDPYYEPKQKIIDDHELERLIAAAQKGHRRYQRVLNVTLLIFLSETGLRASEAANLMMQDVRFSDDPTKAYVRPFGKGGKRRMVPFSKKAQGAILAYLEVRPNLGDRIFWAYNAQHGYCPLNNECIGRRFKALSNATRIPFSAHSLRHYRISKWANDPRISITVAQRWAGHTSIMMTEKYVHLRDEDALAFAFG